MQLGLGFSCVTVDVVMLSLLLLLLLLLLWLQLPLDDVVLSHLTQLDLYVESLRQQLASQAAAAKAAKAAAAEALANAAAGNRRMDARSRSRHTTPRSHYMQQVAAQEDAPEGAGAQVCLLCLLTRGLLSGDLISQMPVGWCVGHSAGYAEGPEASRSSGQLDVVRG
jgi:hypothetical protein